MNQNNVTDMQAYREGKPEHKRRHNGDPLFAERLHIRVPIVSRGMLLALNAIKTEDSKAALDGENSFKTPQELEVQTARNFGSPALYVVPQPAPVEAPPIIPVAETADAAANVAVFSLDAARRLVAESHADHAEQTSQQAQLHTSAQIIDLAERRAALAQEADTAQDELDRKFNEIGWTQGASRHAV